MHIFFIERKQNHINTSRQRITQLFNCLIFMFIYFVQGPGFARPFQKEILSLSLLSLDYLCKAGPTPWSVFLSYHKTITKLLLLRNVQVSCICAASRIWCYQIVHYVLLQTVSNVTAVVTAVTAVELLL